jgi:hypothetical protein
MFGIQAQGYAASHSYWVSVSVPPQTSPVLSSRLIAPTGKLQATALPSISGLVVDQLNVDCPDWKVALQDAKPWRAKARDGAIYRQHYVQDSRSEVKSSF